MEAPNWAFPSYPENSRAKSLHYSCRISLNQKLKVNRKTRSKLVSVSITTRGKSLIKDSDCTNRTCTRATTISCLTTARCYRVATGGTGIGVGIATVGGGGSLRTGPRDGLLAGGGLEVW